VDTPTSRGPSGIGRRSDMKNIEDEEIGELAAWLGEWDRVR
jgi:hypothetical protein